jgi:dTDP-4-dehydrorhamnose 3,5-epimerase
LSDEAEFTYKCTNFYDSEDEGWILWNDPSIAIDWPIDIDEVILSEKDKKWNTLKEKPVVF